MRKARRWLIALLAAGAVLATIITHGMRPQVALPPGTTASPPAAITPAAPSPLVKTEDDAAPGSTAITTVTPPPALRPLPASNAFTTMDDYRQRRAAVLHSPEPMTPPPAGRTPETELGRVSLLVRDYRAAYGTNPVGNNREIVRTLLGDNPRGSHFLDPASISLNERGELLDAWGHPYFFHALSGTTMEIRSAGPDGKPYTADDLVR